MTAAGMPPDGLALAVQRHCTSKLPEGDLVRIATLGFRGEALPSIGAAARLSIISRHCPAAPTAHRIAVAGGNRRTARPPPPARPAPAWLSRTLFFATPRAAQIPQIPPHGSRPRPKPPSPAWRSPAPPRRLSPLRGRPHPVRSPCAGPRRPRGRPARPGRRHRAAPHRSRARDGVTLSGFACAPHGQPRHPLPASPSSSTAAPSRTRCSASPSASLIGTSSLPAATPSSHCGWIRPRRTKLDVNVHPAKNRAPLPQTPTRSAAWSSATLQRALAAGAGGAAPPPRFAPGPSFPAIRFRATPASQKPSLASPPPSPIAPPATRDFPAAIPPDAATHPLGAPRRPNPGHLHHRRHVGSRHDPGGPARRP